MRLEIGMYHITMTLACMVRYVDTYYSRKCMKMLVTETSTERVHHRSPRPGEYSMPCGPWLHEDKQSWRRVVVDGSEQCSGWFQDSFLFGSCLDTWFQMWGYKPKESSLKTLGGVKRYEYVREYIAKTMGNGKCSSCLWLVRLLFIAKERVRALYGTPRFRITDQFTIVFALIGWFSNLGVGPVSLSIRFPQNEPVLIRTIPWFSKFSRDLVTWSTFVDGNKCNKSGICWFHWISL